MFMFYVLCFCVMMEVLWDKCLKIYCFTLISFLWLPKATDVVPPITTT